MAEWKESEHPRDDAGKFTDKAGGASYRSEVNERIRWARENNVELPLNDDGSLNDVKLQKIYSERRVKASAAGEKKNYRHFDRGEDANDFFKKEELSWSHSLNAAQKEAINEYTQDSFLINTYLRSGNLTNSNVLEKIEAVDKAIENFYLEENITVWRHIKEEEHENVNEQLKAKREYTNQGYYSTSLIYDAVSGSDILFEIDIPAGKGIGAYINSLSEYKDAEYEFLLKKGSTFEYIEEKERDGKKIYKWRLKG